MAPITRLSMMGTPARRVAILAKQKFVPELNSIIARSVIGRRLSKVGIRSFGARVINRTSRVKVVKR